MEQRICPICGQAFTPKSGRGVYCSPKCARQAQTERRIDYIHKRVKGKAKQNINLYYAFDFSCAICGWTLGNWDYGPSCGNEWHHIVPVSEGGTNNEENLVLLCPNCHKMAHAGMITREELQRHTFTAEAAEKRRIEYGLALGCGTYWVDNVTLYRNQFKRKIERGEEI